MVASKQVVPMWKQLQGLLLYRSDEKSELGAAHGSEARTHDHNDISANSKRFNYSLAVIFLSFAFMQLNDPDPVRWMLIYGLVALVSLLAGHGMYCRDDVLMAGLVACVVWTLVLLPEFISWIQMGMPTITGSMKAEEPHIEYTREFLGLILCALVLLVNLRDSKKSASQHTDASKRREDEGAIA